MKNKKISISMAISIGIACFLLVMVIFMQFKVVQETEETDVDSMTETELRAELATWKSKYDDAKEKYDEIEATLETYKQESTTDSQTKQTLEEELENLQLLLGTTDVQGEGVIITFSEKTESELSEDEEIKPITAEDLIYIVNYLKDAGAEAISINGERIVNTTDIADVGDTIKINSKYIRESTFTVKAIGNSSYLESSLFGKGGFVEQLNYTGIKSEIERSNSVQISKYDGNFETKYMQEDTDTE